MGATVLSKIVLLGEEEMAAVTTDESEGMGAEGRPGRGKKGTKLEALEEDGTGILRLMEGMVKATEEWLPVDRIAAHRCVNGPLLKAICPQKSTLAQ